MSAAFRYRARHLDGTLEKGILVAQSVGDLEEKLGQQNLTLVHYSQKAIKQRWWDRLSKPRNLDDLLLTFTLRLSIALDQRSSIKEAIQKIEEDYSGSFKTVVMNIQQNIMVGNTLSQALEPHKDWFGVVYMSIVEAGEESGQLKEATKDLVQFLNHERERKKQKKSFAIKPLLNIGGLLLGFYVVITQMIPAFETILKEANLPMPDSAQTLLDIKSWLDQSGGLLLVFLGIGLFLWFPAKRMFPRWGKQLDRAKLKSPVFGNWLMKNELVTLSHFWRVLLVSRIPNRRALPIASRICSNHYFKLLIGEVVEDISQGEEVVEAFESKRVFPGFFIQMLEVGQSTENFSDPLQQVEVYYEEEVEASAKTFFMVIKPMLIAVSLVGLLQLGTVVMELTMSLVNVGSNAGGP